MLHDDRELFLQVVLRTSESLNIRPEIVEKDYYVTLLLKEIYSLMPEIVFKGGTSLSKCYHLIKRFSEDILKRTVPDKPNSPKQKYVKA